MKKHTLLIIIILSSIAVRAQNEMRVVGKGEYLPSELIDKTIRDANGDVCAALVCNYFSKNIRLKVALCIRNLECIN